MKISNRIRRDDLAAEVVAAIAVKIAIGLARQDGWSIQHPWKSDDVSQAERYARSLYASVTR